MQVPQHRRENPLVIWYLCSLYKAFHLFHVHLGTFPVDLVPTTLMVLRNTCLIVHENIAMIGYYYTTWRTLEESDVGDQALAAATDGQLLSALLTRMIIKML